MKDADLDNEINWFSDNSFALIKPPELAQAVFGSCPTVQLPSFQRDAAWDEKRVEALWDSILRGFPIGSLLFARPQKLAVRRLQRSVEDHPYPSQEENESSVRYLLIDGQQRATSIALGFHPWQKGQLARLWFDLGHAYNSKLDQRFGFYLCTIVHPWGWNAPLPKRRDALQSLGMSELPGDDHKVLGTTWPLQAKIPVPFAEILKLVEQGRLHRWHKKLPPSLRDNISPDTLTSAQIKQKQKELQHALSYQIPILLIEDLPEITELGTAFQRLNSQGMRMSPDDLFFSGLKMHWPQAHDLVWEIYQDAQTGKFLKPPQIVHLATRLVATSCLEDVKDPVQIDLEQFRRLTKVHSGHKTKQGKGTEVPFLVGIKELLNKGPDGAYGKLHRYLQQAKEALVYRQGKNKGQDLGLPLPLLAELRWRVWHTLVAWIERHGQVDKESRKEMLRYALLDHFFIKKASDDVARQAFQVAQQAEGVFPGKKIFEAYRDPAHHCLEPELYSPQEYEAALTDKEGCPRGEILANERALVMWAQRKYLAQWFPTFDPTRYITAEEKPYDADHILPWSHLDRRGRNNNNLPKIFQNYRDYVANAPGNIRYWPKSENRSDQNNKVSEKLFLTEQFSNPVPDGRLDQYQLHTCGDLRQASLILEDEIELWQQVSEGKTAYDWTDPARLEAMRQVMTARRIRIYRTFFETMGFQQWI